MRLSRDMPHDRVPRTTFRVRLQLPKRTLRSRQRIPKKPRRQIHHHIPRVPHINRRLQLPKFLIHTHFRIKINPGRISIRMPPSLRFRQPINTRNLRHQISHPKPWRRRINHIRGRQTRNPQTTFKHAHTIHPSHRTRRDRHINLHLQPLPRLQRFFREFTSHQPPFNPTQFFMRERRTRTRFNRVQRTNFILKPEKPHIFHRRRIPKRNFQTRRQQIRNHNRPLRSNTPQIRHRHPKPITRQHIIIHFPKLLFRPQTIRVMQRRKPARNRHPLHHQTRRRRHRQHPARRNTRTHHQHQHHHQTQTCSEPPHTPPRRNPHTHLPPPRPLPAALFFAAVFFFAAGPYR